MAEVVGLMASIIALAGLAEVSFKTVKTIKSIAEDLKTVREDLTDSISRVGWSADIINVAQKTLQAYCERQKSTNQSHVIRFIESKEASRYLEKESLSIRKQLRQFRREIRSLLDLRLTLLVTLRWRHSLKQQLESFQKQMQLVQSGLTTILVSVQLEVAMQRYDRDELEM